MKIGRPAIYDSPEAMAEAMDNYFATTTPKEWTITGIALELGFESRQSFYDYEDKADFSYIIKRARLFVENAYELKLAGNACTGAIFALKNMGWKDKTEQEIHGAVPVQWNETRNYPGEKPQYK